MLKDSSIEQIVERCIQGEEKAQRELFKRYRNIFYSLAYKYLNRGYDIDFAVNEIFLQLFEGLPQYKGLSSFNTWAYRIGVNVCITLLRKWNSKKKIQFSNTGQDIESFSEKRRNPESNYEKKELRELIKNALDKIDPKKRAVIVLHDMEEMKINEISEIVEVPPGTVKSKLFHGRRELAKYLKGYV